MVTPSASVCPSASLERAGPRPVIWLGEREATGDAQVTIAVHGVAPNTVLHVLRAGDFGLSGGQQNDGVCQRAAQSLFTPALTPDGTALTLETSAGGSGQVHAHLTGPTPDGTRIDAVYRLVDATTAPAIDLRTPCFTFEVK